MTDDTAKIAKEAITDKINEPNDETARTTSRNHTLASPTE